MRFSRFIPYGARSFMILKLFRRIWADIGPLGISWQLRHLKALRSVRLQRVGNLAFFFYIFEEFLTMSLRIFTESRKQIRTTITKLHNDRSNFNSYDLPQLNSTKLRLSKIENELSGLNEKIANLKFPGEDDEEDEGETDGETVELQKELKSCEDYSRKICDCQALINLTLTGTGNSSVNFESANLSGNTLTVNTNTPMSLLKSPVAPLPKYTSAEGENLLMFFKQFEETLSKFRYTQYDKLLLLKQQITGKASLLIDSLEPDKETYNDAKALLTSALASTEIQKHNVIKQISELKLGYNTEPFQYISDVRKILQSVESLEISVDDILTYFVFNGLNDLFKSQLTLITNSLRPDLKDITENFFMANERYENARKNKPGKSQMRNDVETATHAINSNVVVSNPFNRCPLCDKSDHGINKCKVYPQPADKLAKLKKLNGCTKCSNTDHFTEACNFRFRKPCNLCNKYHFMFLCPERTITHVETKNGLGEKKPFVPGKAHEKTRVDFHKPPFSNGGVRPKQGKNNTGLICGIVNASYSQQNVDIDAALSTCTVISSDESKYIRCLYDIGSQSSFVSEKMLTQIDHTILNENVNLTIKGINNSKCFHSKLVEARLNFDGHIFVVNLLTVPSIDIHLKLPHLNKVVSEFSKREFILADRLLTEKSNSLNNVGLILGANAAHCFIGETVKFGNSSVYLRTKFGIMFLGSIRVILEDLPRLGVECNVERAHRESKPLSVYPLDIHTECFAINLGLNMDETIIAPNPVNVQSKHDMVIKDTNDQNFETCSEPALENTCSFHLDKEDGSSDEMSELNVDLIKFLLNNFSRTEDGRIILPLLWNTKVKHLLAKNFNISRKILDSNFKKLNKAGKLEMVDANVRELESMDIIEKVPNLENFMQENPTCSFLPHNCIFKMDKETSKVRMVFMSNLSEKYDQNCLSHNQCMYSGPSINQKLSTALIQLRFDAKLLVFDIQKAFCQIMLPETDMNKLLFLWYKNVGKEDFSLVAYRNKRLSFGLSPSPCILMVALYCMLIRDSSEDDEKLAMLKKLIYSLTYMDNCAVSMETSEDLVWAYTKLGDIFTPYKMMLQQFCTNDPHLREIIGQEEDLVSLFGIKWNTVEDEILPNKKYLDPLANTKRKILRTIAQNFDPYNIDGPMLNRARLFMHDLQCQKHVGWDDKLSPDQLRLWRNIVNQLNAASPISVKRYIGSRTAKYELLCFTDSSKLIYGCVIYLHNLDTNEVHFVLAKNRIVGKDFESKSIPALEFAAIMLGTETLQDVQSELSGKRCLFPISIDGMQLFTDSLVCLNWLNSAVNKLDKLNKLSIFVRNRIEKILRICNNYPITFTFVDGIENPADAISRPFSYRQLLKSNYITGPAFLKTANYDMSRADILTVTVPNPVHFPPRNSAPTSVEECEDPTSGAVRWNATTCGAAECSTSRVAAECGSVTERQQPTPTYLIPVDKYSNLNTFVAVHQHVFTFIDKLKRKLRCKEGYSHILCNDNPSEMALNYILKCEQAIQFSDVLLYFNSPNSSTMSIPNLVKQLNVFIDGNGILRVGSKMLKGSSGPIKYCPILLPKSGNLTDRIILNMHKELHHSGIYCVLSQLRKKFWIPCIFSVVKKTLQTCLHCKRFNARTVKLNQNVYRDFRLEPGNKPFSTVAIDYAGPYRVRDDGVTKKVYILVITCLFTRGINLKVSVNLTTDEFLRSFQLHCYEYGLPIFVLSDLGSSLVSGADIVVNFLSDPQTISYLEKNGAGMIKFHNYYKGHHQLGSLVETCVKATKRLISGAMKNNVLKLRDFEFIVCKTVHIVNRRPVAFKDSLRDTTSTEVPQPITPELLIHGFDLTSVNIIPSLQTINYDDCTLDPDFDLHDNIRKTCEKLAKVRMNLLRSYNEEFIPHLISQATDQKSRYEPKTHHKLELGDLVLIKEENTKPSNFPMGRIESVTVNELGESTGAVVLKGSTGERVKRHAGVLIPLLQQIGAMRSNSSSDVIAQQVALPQRSRRAAALASEQRSRAILAE